MFFEPDLENTLQPLENAIHLGMPLMEYKKNTLPIKLTCEQDWFSGWPSQDLPGPSLDALFVQTPSLIPGSSMLWHLKLMYSNTPHCSQVSKVIPNMTSLSHIVFIRHSLGVHCQSQAFRPGGDVSTVHAAPCYSKLLCGIPLHSMLAKYIPRYSMLFHTISCYSTLFHAIPYYFTLFYVIPCYPYAIPCFSMLLHAIPHYSIIPLFDVIPRYSRPFHVISTLFHLIPCDFILFMLFNLIPCNFTLFHAIPYHSMLFHVILCYSMLFHAIPCDSMSFHVIPCYSTWFHIIPRYSMWFQTVGNRWLVVFVRHSLGVWARFQAFRPGAVELECWGAGEPGSCGAWVPFWLKPCI